MATRSAASTATAVFATPSTVYLLGLTKSLSSYTLHITSLSTETGEVVHSGHIPSSISTGLSEAFILSDLKAPQTAPHVVWFEQGKIKALELTPELKAKSAAVKGAVYKKITDVGLSEHGQFVAIAEDGSGRVMKLTPEGLKAIWEYSDSSTSPSRTDSIYSGGLDVDGNPYIARVFWTHTMKTMSAHVLAPHLADEKGLVTGYTFPFKTGEHGIIQHVALEAANPEQYRVLARLLVTTSTGAIQMWQQDQLQWVREEGLADISAAELVELPERKAASQGESEQETFGARVVRQLLDAQADLGLVFSFSLCFAAQGFPQYAANFVRRFVTGSYASVSASVAPPADANASEPLARDAFGFRKVIVAATPYGKLYGIDSANGAVLWSRLFGLGWAAKVGGQVIPAKMFVTRTVADGEAPQVVLVTQRKANNGLVDTVVFHVDALTGEDARAESPSAAGDLLQGEDAIAGPLVEAFLLNLGGGRTVVLLDEFLQVHLYPETDAAKDAFKALATSLRIPLRGGQPGQRRLIGHQVPEELEFTGRHVAYPAWSLPFPAGQDVLALFARPGDPVASLGKVLGNRTTLYKYLNPNVVGVLTGPPAAAPLSDKATCGVYLVDGAKGTILYEAAVPSVRGRCDVKAVLVENWLVYHYYDDDVGVNQAKGYRVVSVELYEGRGIDDKRKRYVCGRSCYPRDQGADDGGGGGSSDMSSLSNGTADVSVYEQAFVFPRGIRTLAPTSTSYGISVKDIIVANENGQIQSFPRRFLDPRRPKHKPTAEESEEWLIQYDAVLPDDPKRVLSHEYQVRPSVLGVMLTCTVLSRPLYGLRLQVAKTQKIITSPALLESTSLVFAYGLDMFFTRVAPSNTFDVLSESFNKAQLVVTVAGLALAIVVVKPIVARRKLRERWYD
uniref:ER membrane protein complex subunit 1 n=1 Tax=Ganoderma boninense TaxID=34458 RepID=A0A5K1JVE8_9APHY|nr:Non-canonical non-ribosomal peptide synthetase FUB8 (EC (Fusaric acid biosynthesis protein 8) [Ganoderma boninense]